MRMKSHTLTTLDEETMTRDVRQLWAGALYPYASRGTVDSERGRALVEVQCIDVVAKLAVVLRRPESVLISPQLLSVQSERVRQQT